MRNLWITVLLFLPLAACNNQNTMNQTIEKTAIEKVLFTYGEALNTANVNAVLQVYTADGVFMPTTLPTATGTAQLKESYTNIFNTIQLNVKFAIEEVVVTGDVAFARTSSKGTVLIFANKQVLQEENREFFFLKKEGGAWKISRYMFNKAK